MKKIISVLIVLIMLTCSALALVGCNNTTDDSGETEEVKYFIPKDYAKLEEMLNELQYQADGTDDVDDIEEVLKYTFGIEGIETDSAVAGSGKYDNEYYVCYFFYSKDDSSAKTLLEELRKYRNEQIEMAEKDGDDRLLEVLENTDKVGREETIVYWCSQQLLNDIENFDKQN